MQDYNTKTEIAKEDVSKGNIGFDFGTTYSVIAGVKKNKQFIYEPEAIHRDIGDNDTLYDSLVLEDIKTNYLSFAQAARLDLGSSNKIVHRGFKLKLSNDDEDYGNISKEGLPAEEVVEKYIHYLLGFLRNQNIDRLVVGVPLIWRQNLHNNALEKYLDIIRKEKIAETVEYITEPVAACSYFAENYRKYNDNHFYEGHLLLIDYGGGTLDITLCEITNRNDRPYVDDLENAGAGANSEGKIGKAGLEFNREVIRIALKYTLDKENYNDENQKIIVDALLNSGKLDKATLSLEKYLRDLSSGLDSLEKDNNNEYRKFINKFCGKFRELTKRKLDRLSKDDDCFIDQSGQEWVINIPRPEVGSKNKILWDEEEPIELNITFGMVAQAYKNIIYEPFEEQLDKIKNTIEEKGINYSSTSDNFKIQLIGGFSNFYLVREQAIKFFGIAKERNEDKRLQGIIDNSDDRLKAVAYGAALEANDLTTHPSKAEASIGITGRKGVTYWAIKRKQTYIHDRIYLFKDDDGAAISILDDQLKRFTYTDPYGVTDTEDIIETEKEKLKLRYTLNGYIWGISFDKDEVITFHWWEITDVDKLENVRIQLEEMINSNNIPDGIKKADTNYCKLTRLLTGDNEKNPVIRTGRK